MIFLRSRGFSAEIAGQAIACYGFGNIAGSAFGGWLADRFGRRNTASSGGAFASALRHVRAALSGLKGIYLVMLCR